MEIKEIIIGKARKYNCYIETNRTCGRQCRSCFRWRFSYPYTCNDYDMYSEKAETCLNYDENRDCKIE